VPHVTYWNARHLGDARLKAMKERGRVRVGAIADLTLFNPDTVAPGPVTGGRRHFSSGRDSASWRRM